MRRGKMFRFFYMVTLSIFTASAAALAFRLGEQRRGNQFYQQAGKRNEAFAAAAPAALQSAASLVQSALFQGQEYQTAPHKPNELSRRVSRLAGEYSHVAAWLQIPGTSVDYPVVLGSDNQFYLDHLPDGSKNALGSLFLDYRSDENSLHLIIYGHNGAGGKMFGQLKEYESREFFAEHKTLTLTTQDSSYVCPIFSVRRVKEDSDAYMLDFEDRDALIDYVNQAAAESLYPIDADFRNTERVVTLSTCTGWSNQRFLVQAVLQSP